MFIVALEPPDILAAFVRDRSAKKLEPQARVIIVNKPFEILNVTWETFNGIDGYVADE